MRTNNEGVVRAWARGEEAHSHTSNLTTDGRSLWSYALKIAHRSASGTTIVGDFTSPGGYFASTTTSCHVGKAKRVADEVFHPEVFRNSENLWAS